MLTNPAPRCIAITTGDSNGIGLEVTYKALARLKSGKTRFLIFRPQKKSHPICWPLLPPELTAKVESLDDAKEVLLRNKPGVRFIEICSKSSPAQWVLDATKACLNKEVDGLVTGPVSKKTFIDSGLPYLGHTPLLQDVSKSKCAYMAFLGKHFNVVLATGHMPLSKVETSLSFSTLNEVLKVALKWSSYLPINFQNRPIGLLGLNPHSGENGMIGKFEKTVLSRLLTKYPEVVGPLVPDSAWNKENWKRFSFFISLYHDQGLIPFKMIHGHSGGAHVTLGIPFVRTSVDHGTAIDIVGKGVARPESMCDAIRWCEVLVRNKG